MTGKNNQAKKLVTSLGSPIILIDDLKKASRPKNRQKKQKHINPKAVAAPIKKQNLTPSIYKQYFNNLIEIETDVAISLQLFNQKRQALTKEQAKENPNKETIKGFKEQLNALASITLSTSNCLIEYYKQYDCQEQQNVHQKISSMLQAYLINETFLDIKNTKKLIPWIVEHSKKKGQEVINTLLKASKMRNAIGEVSMTSSYWIYCHLTADQILATVETTTGFDKNKANFVTPDLDSLKPIVNFTGVAFNGARFLIETGLLLKHSIWPGEKEAEVYWQARLAKEWHKRKIPIINNMIGTISSILTNYVYVNLPISNQITAAVLIINIAVAYWTQKEEKKKYKKVLLSFENKITELEKKLKALRLPTNKDEIKHLNIQLILEKEKIKTLKNNSLLKDYIYKLNIDAALIITGSFISATAADLSLLFSSSLIPSVAPILAPVFAFAGMGLAIFHIGKHNKPLAAFLGVGFTAAYILCPPAALLMSFIVGMTATAICLSNKELSQLNSTKQEYWQFAAKLLSKEDETASKTIKLVKTMSHHDIKQQLLKLKNVDVNSKDLTKLDKLQKNIASAKYKLAKAMLERTVIPVVIFLTFAVYWPAAVSIIVTYMAFKIYQAVKSHKEKSALNNETLETDSPTSQLPNLNSFFKTPKNTNNINEKNRHLNIGEINNNLMPD